MTADELRAIEARAEAATPGEWRLRKGEGLWWAVEVELPSINGLRCWYTIARFDFDMAANGYTDGALRPEADATLLVHARQDIPRLAAALREARQRVAEMTVDASTLDRILGHLGIADTDIDPVEHVAQVAAMAEVRAAAEARAIAAEADSKRLQDEVAALDAARREAEAGAAEMREALEQQAVQVTDDGDDEAIPVRCLYECALCLAEGPTRKAIVHASSCTLASPTPGAALLAELEDWRGLKDPAALVVNLLRGTPAALTRDQFLHLAGATDYPALLAERDRLREALEEIANPISAMRRRAEADGMKLNGMAAQLARDPYYLQNIARAALKETSNG